ncbi:hypothetical protein ACTMSW_13045 [Micromonospora sp. BQ11]|uniref:hypothetical protein n=1 Tax=Micromonospora sp. BQ11 TaxID=3452212 RepID=UPI003F8B5650
MPIPVRRLLAPLFVTVVTACSGRPAVRPAPTASPAPTIGGDRPADSPRERPRPAG